MLVMQDAMVWFIGGKGCSNKDEVRSKKIMSESILNNTVHIFIRGFRKQFPT